jgi:DNA-binding IclR family transcriptional regulator
MEETIFRAFVGDSPTTRVIEFLIEGEEFDWSITDLAEKAGVSWRTIHRLVPNLLESGLIKSTRTIGRAKLFQLNKENPSVQKLIALFNSLLAQELERVAEENLIKAEI